MKTLIDAVTIAKAHAFTSTEQVRYYLQGVSIEPTKSGAVFVATDGMRLGIFNWTIEGEDATYIAAPAIVKLPKDFLRECKSQKNQMNAGQLLVEIDHAQKTATLLQRSPSTGTKALAIAIDVIIDATFPAWRKVIPSFKPQLSITADSYNPKLLATFAEAGDKKDAPITVYNDREGYPALVFVDSAPNFIGVIMPSRKGEENTAHTTPGWLQDVIDQDSQQKAA